MVLECTYHRIMTDRSPSSQAVSSKAHLYPGLAEHLGKFSDGIC